MTGQTGWTDEKVNERAEFVGRTMKELSRLLRTGGGNPELSEQIAQAWGALESIRIALWQRELGRAATRPTPGPGASNGAQEHPR